MMKTIPHPGRVPTLFQTALLVASIAAAGSLGCSPSQCQTNANCPAGQVCNTTGTCIAGGGSNDGTPDGGSGCGACSGATPVCNSATGQCVTCTATQGCPAGETCDTSVTGGRCIGCQSDRDCSGAQDVCDVATGACVTCVADDGCPGETCDTSVAGGQCVGCLTNGDCHSPHPVCNTSTRTCVGCMSNSDCPNGGTCTGGQCVSSSGCTADSQCSGATPACDTASGKCVTCTSTDGCSGATPQCDTSAAGGHCVGCLSNGDCRSPDAVCATSTQTCVVCQANGDCPSGETCNTSVTGGQCVSTATCTSDSQCSGATPVCDTASGRCVTCTSTKGCSGATAKCDTSVAGGKCVACLASNDCTGTNAICANQACVACTATQGCTSATKCDTAADKCVQCLSNADCSGSTPVCQDGTCVAGTVSGTGSASIAAARAATPGAKQSLAISGVFVTYLKPATGNDIAGFFIQAEQAGPALFVGVDPSTLSPVPQVGDEVSFTITDLEELTGVTYAKAISSYARTSAGNSVAGLVKDVSAASDVVTNIDHYESRLVKVTGTIASPFTASGAGHMMAQITTQGMPTASANFVLRVPQTLQAALGLAQGCTFTLESGPMWRFTSAGTTPTTSAEPTSYSQNDFDGIASCPAPKLLSASATAATTVVLTFDRPMDPSSVQANGSQFPITDGSSSLAVIAATASGTTVTLTTGSQTAGTSYTVTVDASVKDADGTGVDSSHDSATFSGFGGSCSPAVVISQVFGGGGNTGAPFNQDYVELHNRGTTTVSVAGWTVQYASASTSSGTTTWHVTASLTGSIAPGGYYLVGEYVKSSGTGGALPTPDASGTQDLSESNGVVALVNNATMLGSCTDSSIVDLVGYGSGPSLCEEGSGAAPALSSTTAAVRKDNGCTDTNVNQADFDVGTPAPHNSASTAAACGCQ